MYKCICIYIHIYAYIYIHLLLGAQLVTERLVHNRFHKKQPAKGGHTCKYICIYVYVYIHRHAYIYIYTSAARCAAGLQSGSYIIVSTRNSLRREDIHINIYVYMYMYIYIDMHVYIYTSAAWCAAG